MKASRVHDIDEYRSPLARSWSQTPGVRIPLMPAPLSMQPSEYVRRSWEGRPYGQTAALEAASVHDGRTWAIRVGWEGGAAESASFPDALAVALPVRHSAPLILMGSAEAPIHILRWQVDKQGVRSLLATGVGRSAPGPTVNSTAQTEADQHRCQVVVTRALGAGGDVAPLEAGRTTSIGFALWRGANNERAGVKAFSIDWTVLALEA
ncbi:MAG: hypothetical protein RBS02_12865 [Steroidobacteraceae bacterium]|jgi:DMSO reductase family type II enzyme heme b subunit|nr:hypothetical protein [Steroidobacteraceae bacterium]